MPTDTHPGERTPERSTRPPSDHETNARNPTDHEPDRDPFADRHYGGAAAAAWGLARDEQVRLYLDDVPSAGATAEPTEPDEAENPTEPDGAGEPTGLDGGENSTSHDERTADHHAPDSDHHETDTHRAYPRTTHREPGVGSLVAERYGDVEAAVAVDPRQPAVPVELELHLDGSSISASLEPVQARALADALRNAADEVERWREGHPDDATPN